MPTGFLLVGDPPQADGKVLVQVLAHAHDEIGAGVASTLAPMVQGGPIRPEFPGRLCVGLEAFVTHPPIQQTNGRVHRVSPC